MKKVLFYFTAAIMLPCIGAQAQLSAGGTPLAMNTDYSKYILPQSDLPQVSLTAPNVAALLQEDKADNRPLKPFRIGAVTAADINFPLSGSFSTLPDGRRIWRMQISMPGALAMGLYYDKFHLPVGVNMFLYNANYRQVLGAYTADNNNDDNTWATEKVQGSLINIEMDIDADVNLSQIQMHINEVADFYKAIGYLSGYALDGTAEKTTTLFQYGGSSPCEINAICPLGVNFPHQREATVTIQYQKQPFIYAGTGTLMNNTSQDCTPYVMTASHVEPTNSTSNTTFSNWIFYFNYETPTCTYTGAVPVPKTLEGATFKARASYDSASDKIVGDFLLVRLKNAVPANYGAYFSGWDRATTATVANVISFHHPSGDVKKLSTAATASPNGNFNNGEQNSHWLAIWDQGGTEEGSSGSGLFESNGRLIGDLSGGSEGNSCDTNSYGDYMSVDGAYSKFSLNWLYTFETPSDSATRLKDWLDPTNTGLTVLDAVAAQCAPAAVPTIKTASAGNVDVYPNPTTGVTYVSLNLATQQNVTVEVYNIVGTKQLEMSLPNVQQGEYKVDLGNYASGMYLVRVTTDNGITTKKVILSK